MATAQPSPGAASGLEPVLRESPRLKRVHCGLFGNCLAAGPNETIVTDEGDHAASTLSCDEFNISELHPQDESRVITGLIQQDNELLMLEKDGNIFRSDLGHLGSNRKNIGKWKVDVGKLVHGAALGRHLLVCLDGKTGEVFTVSLQPDGTVHKRVKLQLQDIKNGKVACTGIDDQVRIAIAEPNLHRVEVYDAKWKLHTTIGGQDGGFDPQDCIFLPWGNLLVADTNNDRVSEYRLDARSGHGQLFRHWLTTEHDVYKPRAVSFLARGDLWVINISKLRDSGEDNLTISRCFWFRILKKAS